MRQAMVMTGLAVTQAAMAHPGHGQTAGTASHALGHTLMTAIVIATIAAVAWRLLAHRKQG